MNSLKCSSFARTIASSTLALACVLTLAACGPDLDTMRAGPIPMYAPEFDESTLPPEPGIDADLAEKIEWEMLESTSRYARVGDPEAEAECPELDLTRDSESVCTVTFWGVRVQWDVTINDRQFTTTYQVAPRGRHVVRDVAEELLRHERDTETVRCDMEEVHVVSTATEDDPTTCVWGRDRDSWKTSGRHGVVAIATTPPAAGMMGSGQMWFTSVEQVFG